MTSDYYEGLCSIYFRSILFAIIRIGSLDRSGLRILDFGCGHSRLGSMLPNVDRYDIDPELSEIEDWTNTQYDVVILNEVFYMMSENEINMVLMDITKYSPSAVVIVGIARQNLMSRILKYPAGLIRAHDGTKTSPKKEKEILDKYYNCSAHAVVFGMCDIYLYTKNI